MVISRRVDILSGNIKRSVDILSGNIEKWISQAVIMPTVTVITT